MVDVVVEASSLNRSGSGSVTGQVFLRGPTGDFPQARWSDFPVVVLGWWIAGLTEVAVRNERSFQGMFMDGTFAFVVQRGAGTSGRIAWGKRGEEAAVGIIDINAFLGSAVSAARVVADTCRSRGWRGRDLETLERAIARSAV
jgi:hypothetical protein